MRHIIINKLQGSGDGIYDHKIYEVVIRVSLGAKRHGLKNLT